MNNRYMVLPWRLAATLLTALIAALGLCDGKFVGHLSEKAPDMPYQRAFIAFDKGQETMIVESFMTGKKGDYVWLVPTPSKPDEIKPCHSHALSGLIETVSPRIEDSITSDPVSAILVLAFSFFYFLAFALYFQNVRNQERRFKFLYALLYSLLVVIGAGILFPVFAQPKPSSHESSPAVASGAAGNYAYTVLTSNKPAETLVWLAKNGYKLDTPTKEAVARNSQKGWYLTVLRYKHPADGQAAPHPVRFTFRADNPIYPMEMTGTGLPKLRLDLVVSMNQQAEVSGMTTVSAANYFSFRHPDVNPFAIDQGVVTFLRGDLGQKELTEDMAIDSVTFKQTFHQRWADKGSFLSRIIFNILFLLPIGYLILSILHAIKPRDAKWWKQASVTMAIICSVAAPAYGLLKYKLIESERGSSMSQYYRRLSITNTAIKRLAGKKVSYPFVDQLVQRIGKQNIGDEPGKCVVEPNGKRARITLFLRSYRPEVHWVDDHDGYYVVGPE